MKNLTKITALAALFLVSLTSMAPVQTNSLVTGEEEKAKSPVFTVVGDKVIFALAEKSGHKNHQ